MLGADGLIYQVGRGGVPWEGHREGIGRAGARRGWVGRGAWGGTRGPAACRARQPVFPALPCPDAPRPAPAAAPRLQLSTLKSLNDDLFYPLGKESQR